jgi:predicted transcriptional regulator
LPASAPERKKTVSSKGAGNGAFFLLKIPRAGTIVERQSSDNLVMIQFSGQFDHLPVPGSRGLSLLSALLLLPLGG